MKLKFITLFTVLVFASTAFVGFAHAQDDEAVKACIPFDFYGGKQKMEAGCYRIGIDLENGTISFTGESGKHKIFLMASPGDEGNGKSLLIFKHVGDVYAVEELESDAYTWTFQTWMPVQQIESRNSSSQVEVALNR